jgi:D-alanyl-D-alanine carboxypeptidase (penicillin-binding protein 5/6)
MSKDPYLGAIVVDADSGEVLFKDNPDVRGYPASMIKMMTLLVVLDAVKERRISLEDKITVSAEVSRIGGSQVYLKEKEVFTVDELLYALMVQSANDAALALALHSAGSKDEFVNLMNKRAEELGMEDTLFYSVHGLPPTRRQLPDVSTPRDITKLARELLKYPDALKYTSTRVRRFRTDAPEPFIMRNHNHLVGDFEGCDGLKTGFFWAAGFSITATAANNDGRAIAVIFGSLYSKVRDKKARELLSTGLMKIAAKEPSPPPPPQKTTASMISWEGGDLYLLILGMVCGVYVIRRFITLSLPR